MPTRPCSTGSQEHFDSIQLVTQDYTDLLALPAIDAIYCAVPHHLHERLYVDIIEAGKHLLGEKPFGIDLAANARIIQAVRRPSRSCWCAARPSCHSIPARSRSCASFAKSASARSWRCRRVSCTAATLIRKSPSTGSGASRPMASTAAWVTWACTCCIFPCAPGGSHVTCARCSPISSRSGQERTARWNHVRPGTTRCWPARCKREDQHFPMLLDIKRIAPGETNTWYIRITGTRFSAEFSTKYPKTLRTMPYTPGGTQAWQAQDLGSQSAYPYYHGRHLRVRLLRLDRADVGRLLRRTGPPWQDAPALLLRDAGRNDAAASHPDRRAALTEPGAGCCARTRIRTRG